MRDHLRGECWKIGVSLSCPQGKSKMLCRDRVFKGVAKQKERMWWGGGGGAMGGCGVLCSRMFQITDWSVGMADLSKMTLVRVTQSCLPT